MEHPSKEHFIWAQSLFLLVYKLAGSVEGYLFLGALWMEMCVSDLHNSFTAEDARYFFPIIRSEGERKMWNEDLA